MYSIIIRLYLHCFLSCKNYLFFGFILRNPILNLSHSQVSKRFLQSSFQFIFVACIIYSRIHGIRYVNYPTQHVLKITPSRATKKILYFEIKKTLRLLNPSEFKKYNVFLFLIASLMKIFFMQPDYPTSHIIEHTILHTVIP